MLNGSAPNESARGLRHQLSDQLKSFLPVLSLIADGLAFTTLWLQGAGLNGFSLAATACGTVGGLAAAGYLVAKQDRTRGKTILATTTLVIGLTMAFIGIFAWLTDDGEAAPQPPRQTPSTAHTSPGNTTASSATPPSSGHITKPTANAKVDHCLKVLGTGTPPQNHTWRLGVAPVSREDSAYYLPRDLRQYGTQWSAWPLHVGAEGDYSIDFNLVLYQLPNSVVPKYSSDKARATPYTAAELKADGIEILEKVRVSRTDATTASDVVCTQEPH